jgi:hypothetical protein
MTDWLPGLENVTRVELIDVDGRTVRYGIVSAHIQDDGRTLKVIAWGGGADEARQAHLDAGWPT